MANEEARPQRMCIHIVCFINALIDFFDVSPLLVQERQLFGKFMTFFYDWYGSIVDVVP